MADDNPDRRQCTGSPAAFGPVGEALALAAVLAVVGSLGILAVLGGSALSALVMIAAIALATASFLLRRDEEQSWTGLLLYAAAVCLSVSDSAAAFGSAGGVVGRVTSAWAVLPLAIVLLTYPRGQLTRPWHRWLLVAVGTEFVGLWSVDGLVELAYPPDDRVLVVIDQALYLGGVTLTILGCAALVQRLRDAAGPERDAVRLVGVIGLAMASTFAVRLLTLAVADVSESLAVTHEVVRILNLVCVGLAPAGLLVEALRRRAARHTLIEELLRASGDAHLVETAMQRALGDLTLHLVTDEHGLPPPDGVVAGRSSRLRRELRARDGEIIGTVDADESTNRDPAQLRVVVAGATLALENTRLQSSLQRSLDEVRRSRARIIEAGLRSRRELERDLHDGAQQRLLAVSTSLARARILPTVESRAAALTDAREQLAGALVELRRLARGIHPAVLDRGGLAHALPTLADASPVPVDVEIPGDLMTVRLRPLVESTLWFVAAEATTNAARHGSATRIRIRVAVCHGEVELVVDDDGRGGAALREGGGLAGLSDRASALGGDLAVHSPPGRGTRVKVSVPCVS